MVQGTTKLGQKKTSGGRSGAAKDMKKGRRVIAPKAPAAVQHHLIRKNLSAKINNSIEKQMVAAASSGKLTIMKHVAGDTRPESLVSLL
ncbi:hypothetical protein BS47DRAFT_1288080 [Hydnum rufescens UP504]|uniref:Uncharacterized protein n=1 Tax=Hydnum rufescens UP504 TaxID=1448309 RepID=A0A9P6E1K1_9AGAM|nr:hypothetical protein BS47DRAFT_1288080 [Hydnum rufescens UP504]